MKAKQTNIAVVGAGIAGITSAYYLAKLGYKVTVFEQESYPAMRCSYANGGQISVSNSEVWYTWANVKKGLKWMFTADAPLLLRPKLSWRKIKWISQFLWNVITKKYRANTSTTIKMALESRSLYYDIIKEEGINFDQTPSGILHFYKNKQYWDAAVKSQEIYQSNGCEWQLVDQTQIAQLEPTLAKHKDIIGGAFTTADFTGDVHKFCVEVAKLLEKKYQVNFVFDHRVGSLNQLADFDAIVVSGGVGSVGLASTVGDSLPIYPVKGYSVTIENVPKKCLPFISLLDEQAKIVTSSLGNRFRVAGTAEFDDENYDIRRDRIQPLLDWIKVNFPNIPTREYRSWACLRPMTPDMLPIVKQSTRMPFVFYNCGHGHLGWTLGAVTGKRVAELIEEYRS